MRTGQGRAGGRAAALALLLCPAAAGAQATAAQAGVAQPATAQPGAAPTAPGTVVTNVAAVSAAGIAPAPSNAAVLVVAERLDVALARSAAADAALPGGERALGATLTNRGSGPEAFTLVVTGGAAGARVLAGGVPVDGTTAVLAPGAALAVTVVLPAGAGAAVLHAAAATGSGAPGTAFPGRGEGGSDAVAGPTGAAAALALDAPAAPPTLDKRQAVLAPDGGTDPVRGAVVTYTLVARFAAPAAAAAIADPVPAGTRFVPGSLALDGAGLPDAGHLAGGVVAVALGPVAAGAVRTLRFQVTIQ